MKGIQSVIFLFICFSCMGGSHRDTIYKTSPLKNGYTLAYKKHDSINYVCLIKDGKETEVSEHESDTTMPLDVLGYLYADFGNSFVLATHIGAEPVKVEVIDKTTGGTIMYGASPFYTDTVKGLMMFEGSYRRRGKLILYDFNTNKSEQYLAPQETRCFCCFCWKLISLTDGEIKINYLDMNYKEAV